MSEKERTAAQLIEKFDLYTRLRRFHDIRTNPSIALPTILVCVVLMPVLYLPSMLAVDRYARRKQMKWLFGSARRLVVSDSTVRRALGWLSGRELQRCLRSVIDSLDARRMFRVRLARSRPKRRLAIVDGTYMSGHWIAVLALTGKITVCAQLRRCRGRGWERHEGRHLIEAAATLGPARPELMLLDALYFDIRTVELIRRADMHVLIKSEQADYRSVTADAENHINACGADIAESDYDGERLCRWWVEITGGSFAGHQVQVARLTERFSASEEVRQCWITTTDLCLSPAELREAAHRRWAIETYFKQLNASTSTKRFALRDPRAFTAMLTLVCIGAALSDAARALIARNPRLARRFLDGEKPTRETWMMRLVECLPEGVFAFGH